MLTEALTMDVTPAERLVQTCSLTSSDIEIKDWKCKYAEFIRSFLIKSIVGKCSSLIVFIGLFQGRRSHGMLSQLHSLFHLFSSSGQGECFILKIYPSITEKFFFNLVTKSLKARNEAEIVLGRKNVNENIE